MARFRAKIRRLRNSLWKLAEQEAMAGFTVKMRYGHLKRLPQDYVGERHTVTTKHLGIRNGQEWVEFEEVPGPEPVRQRKAVKGSEFPTPKGHIIDWVIVKPYPRPGEERPHEVDPETSPENDEQK